MPVSRSNPPGGPSNACVRTWVPTWRRANLVLTGTSSVLARSNGEVVDLLAGGQGVFNIVPLAGVVEELEADIVRLDTSVPTAPAKRATHEGARRRAAGE